MTTSAVLGHLASAGRILRWLAIPAFLALAGVLGGASQGNIVQTGVLEILAPILLLGMILFSSAFAPIGRRAWFVMLAVASVLVWCALQLVRLPAGVWTQLPGRGEIVDAFNLLGVRDLPDLPISLAPEQTILGMLQFAPAICVFLFVARSPSATGNTAIAWTVVGLAVASSVLGIAQFAEPTLGSLYTRGDAGGFFANLNHQASLQLQALPFIAVLMSRMTLHRVLGDIGWGVMLLAVAAAIIMAGAVVISGSIAGYVLLGPVLIASIVIYLRRTISGWIIAILAVGSIILAVVGFLAIASGASEKVGIASAEPDTLGRSEIYRVTGQAALDHFPVGSGLGSFEPVYATYEDADTTTNLFVNHAHNDYLEVALELGLPGIVAILAIVGVLLAACRDAWRQDVEGSRLQRAAAIALLVVLAHSLVDYPLRTLAISSLAAAYAGLLVQSRKAALRPRTGSEPAHHQVLV